MPHTGRVTNPPGDFDEFRAGLVEVCEGAADLFLDGSAKSHFVDKTQDFSKRDQQFWLDAQATDEPPNWINEIAASYLGEAAYELKAIGLLLRTGLVAGTIDLLVRGIVERTGRVMWIMDCEEGIAPNVRGARAGLEMGISHQSYRQALHFLGAKNAAKTTPKADDIKHRELLLKFFRIDRPRNDEGNPKSKPTKDIELWMVDEQTLPSYGFIARLVGTRCGLTEDQAAGVYASLCGYAHPSVVFSREIHGWDTAGVPQIVYRAFDIERLIRIAVVTLTEGVRNAAVYFGANVAELDTKINPILHRLDQLSAMMSEVSPESG